MELASPEELDLRIEALLQEAEQRLSAQNGTSQIALRRPDDQSRMVLQVPALPEAYIKQDGVGAKVDRTQIIRASGVRKVEETVVQKTITKEKVSAGSEWFNMPKTVVTPELKRDLQLLRMRSVLDPKRHYKKESTAKRPLIPEFSQVGTIIEGPTEYYSARLLKKERKRTLVEEILGQEATMDRFKRKYADIQDSKRSGGKTHYKSVQGKRKKSFKK